MIWHCTACDVRLEHHEETFREHVEEHHEELAEYLRENETPRPFSKAQLSERMGD